jgi:hypothetical protein
VTHTYAVLEVSPKVYQEVRALLEAAGYSHAFISGRNEVIDMHGIALAASASEPAPKPEPSDTLERSWERFSEEEKHAQVEVGPARRAFYAGAQSFCSAMGAALDDQVDEIESTKQMDSIYEELAATLTELKL